MSGIKATTRLHLNKRAMTFAVPLQIVALVAVISVLIAVLFLRAGGVPGSAEWVAASRQNGGMAFGLIGFLVYLGVQSVSTTFPFALSLGSTRRDFVGGTLTWAALTSLYLTIVYAVLTVLEVATHHWFVGFYIFDVVALGNGNLWQLIPTVFLGSLALLVIGALFGAAWTRYGSRGPVLLGAGLAVVLLLILVLTLPALTAALTGFRPWWLAVAAVVLIAASAAATVHLLRSAVVR